MSDAAMAVSSATMRPASESEGDGADDRPG
jgi:hypothetical protein